MANAGGDGGGSWAAAGEAALKRWGRCPQTPAGVTVLPRTPPKPGLAHPGGFGPGGFFWKGLQELKLSRKRCLIVGALVLMLGLAPWAMAQPMAPRDWPMEKCARYRSAWVEALARFSTSGLSEAFLADHEGFLASNCKGGRRVCPRSAAEISLANAMTMAALNSGASGSFLPFICRE